MNLSASIIVTLLYGDIFQYPYTEDELRAWLLRSVWAKTTIQKNLRVLVQKKKIVYKEPFYVLFGQQRNCMIRRSREKIGTKKWEKARYVASFFRFIPTITFIGVTGGLALGNTDRNDDIDFFIGALPGTLWITRCVSTILTELLGVRRRPDSTQVKDTICLNMFASEDGFLVPKHEQDIFTAHEVLQMRPLWERTYAYRKFLKKNAWVSVLFPEKWKQIHQNLTVPQQREYFCFLIPVIRLLEQPAKYMQLWYMNKRRTNEVISDTLIRFHPHDARVWIWKELEKKIQQYHLPLDKNFFQT